MNKEKLNVFQEENPEELFPNYQELSQDECKKISKKISLKYLHRIENGLELARSLYDLSKQIEGESAEDNFVLTTFLQRNGICAKEECFIDWYRFDQIDKFRTMDIDSTFCYLYYPFADDICLFDDTLEWLLFINHDRTLNICKSAGS